MSRPGPAVQSSSIGALWLGRATLALAFCGLFLGGGATPLEALCLSAAAAVLALAGWLWLPSGSALRRISIPALAFAAVLVVAGMTVIPVSDGLVRVGGLAAVGGRTLSISPVATLVEIAKLMGLGCAFLCGVLAAQGERTPGKLLDACVALGGLWAAWSLILYLLAGSQGRLGSPFLSPNTAATLLGVGVVLSIGRLLGLRETRVDKDRVRWRRIWLTSAATVMGVGLFLTQSRAGLTIAALGSAGLAVSWPRFAMAAAKPGPRWLGYCGLALALVVALDAARGLRMRLPGLADAAADRGAILQAYWAAFLDAPLLGVGLGAAPYVTKLRLTSDTYEALWNVQSAHNWVLQWLAEGGVLTSVLMGFTLWTVIITVLRGLNGRTGRILLPLLFVDFVVLAHGLMDFALQIPAISIYWSFLLGLQVAFSGRTPGRQRPGPELNSEATRV